MRWLQTRPGFLCFICRIKKLLQLGPTGSTWWGFLARSTQNGRSLQPAKAQRGQ